MPLYVKNNTISSSDITSVGVWYDLSGTGNDVNIYGPSWTTVGGRTAFNFSADGHYMSKSGFSSFPTTQLTYEVWLYPAVSELTGDDRGCVIQNSGGSASYMSWNKSNRYMSNYWYGHAPEGYHETNGPSARGAWHHWCAVWDNKSVHQWVDGTYSVSKNVIGTSTANNAITIGREGGGRQFSGAIAVIRIYNRGLNGYEVYENFQAQRERFGI